MLLEGAWQRIELARSVSLPMLRWSTNASPDSEGVALPQGFIWSSRHISSPGVGFDLAPPPVNRSIRRYSPEIANRRLGSNISYKGVLKKMNRLNPKVDGFISKAKKWQEEFEKLRMIVLDCQLTEELKWGVPCYTFEKRNIVLIHGFKEYCALLFFKGALLKDANGILITQTENVQAGRQVRFTNVHEIVEMETILKAYIYEAIDVEKAGLKVDFKKTTEFIIPVEFQNKIDEIPALKTAFGALTPGRKRAYILYFTAPKQSKTRESRVEKCVQQILNGKGLND
jgi:uncharacterized protein YdeI (YjbR/CyaY-like superfamily)